MRRALPRAGWLLCAALACAAPDAARAPRLVDLSHPFDADTLYWPTEEGFALERGPSGPTPGGYHYEAHRFRAAEHGGTHLDAPVHFHAGGAPVDEVPLASLVGPAVVVDVQGACARDRDHEVRVADLQRFETNHGEIPARAIVLLHTGFGRYWPDRERYLGTAGRGPAAVAALRFPGLHAEAARWLVEERDVAAVGIDTASIDRGASRTFESHRVLAAAGVPILENLAHLERLPPRGAHIFALPMKIAGGSGAPLRAVAVLP